MNAARISLLAGGLFALLATPALAASPTPLVSEASQRCLDVKGSNTGPDAFVQIYDCNAGSNQLWKLTASRELRTLGRSRCLDATGQGTAPGTPVTSNTCTGKANQKWQMNADGTITGQQSGLCLDVIGANTASGTGVHLWNCHGNSNQQWTAGGTQPDTEPPTPPSGLAIADLACRSAILSWAASSDNVGVAFYDVYHDGQKMTTVNGSTLSAALTLKPGAAWGLYVNARDAAGNVSQASATLPIQVPQCEIDTQAPTTPGNLQGSVAGTAATLTWAASSDNIGVIAYDIYRNDVKVGATAALTTTDSGLAPNTTYAYKVAARDAQNNVSPRSSSLSLTTDSACTTAVCSTTQVGTDTDIPWGLVALSDGALVYNRRDAHDIVRLDPATGVKTTVGTVPNVQGTDGEGGLLGLAVTRKFPAADPWLYIYHTSPTDNRIVRIKVNKSGVLDTSTLQVLLSGIGRNKFHNGGRLRIGPDGKLYATTGDAQNGDDAQDIDSLSGKVLRLNRDGSVPSDNPFGNYVWSYGHRNPQGLAFDSHGRLWEQEFGETIDETNLISKGGNYGWPDCEATTSRGGQGCATAGYIAPKSYYSNAEASCSGIAVVRDVLYIACERGTRMYRYVISSDTLTDVQQLFAGTYGRLRTAEPTIDGGLWMTTTNSGDKDSIANNSDERIYKVNLGN